MIIYLILSTSAGSAQETANNPLYVRPTFVLDGDLDTYVTYNDILATRLENVPESVRTKFAIGVNKMSRFKIYSRGGLAERFFLEVDYKRDDKQSSADDDSSIVLRYMGKKGEILKTLELGDTQLDLPGARWLSLKGRGGKVSRQSFAGKGVLTYRDIDLTLVGSHQKGKPEVEVFELSRNQRVIEIKDTEYITRRYYSSADDVELPIDPSSLILFIDDGNGYNNTSVTERFTAAGDTAEGFYDKVSVTDENFSFDLDPRTGIIQFKHDIPFNAAIAVSFRTTFGRQIEKKSIRAADGIIDRELKNRYRLPDDLLDIDQLTVEDKARRQVQVPEYSVDSLQKVVVFRSSRPFDDSAYLYPASNSKTIVISYLATGENSTLYLAKEPIVDSVKVVADGENLIEGTDYTVQSGSGRGSITLFGIRNRNRLEVTYNTSDVPQTRQTAGAAMTYGAEKPITFTLSGLYDFAPRTTRVPHIGSDIPKVQMFGTSLAGKDKVLGTNVKVNVEMAGTRFDPNPYGASMVESMDSSKRSLPLEAREEFWKPSSKPPAVTGNRSAGAIEFGSLYVREIVPSNPSDRRTQTMSFGAGMGEWFGVSRALAPKRGSIDLRTYRTAEMFVYSDGSGGRLTMEVGEVSEDINANLRLDTEDTNGDSLVDASEDSGLPLESGNVFGRGNNLLDTEDLDLNGRLSSIESSIKLEVPLTWTGWQKVRMPLDGISSARFIRIWVNGASRISIANVEFAGFDYVEEKSPGSELSLSIVSNFSDIDAPQLGAHPTFLRLYPQRDVNQIDKSEYERERQEDFALSMDYSLPSAGMVLAKKDVQLDLTNQQEVHFFLSSTNTTNVVFALRLGSISDYFEYTIPVSQLSPSYQEFNIQKDRFRPVGNPDWQDIREIRLVLRNPGATLQKGKVYFNELFMDKSVVREAIAVAGEADLSHPLEISDYWASKLLGNQGDLFATGSVTQIPSDFRTPDESIRGQNIYKFSSGWKSDTSFLSVSHEQNQEQTELNRRGSSSQRIGSTYFSANRLDWDIKCRVVDWQSQVSGNAEIRRRIEPNLKESREQFQGQAAIENTRLSDWYPKRNVVDGRFSRDLVLQQTMYGAEIRPRWSVWSENITVEPRASFEETVVSSSNYILARNASAGAKHIVRYGALDVESDFSSENQLQRAEYVSFQQSVRTQSNVSVNFASFGRFNISGSLSEQRVYVSTHVTEDPSRVMTYLFIRPSQEADTFRTARETAAAQENIRFMKLLGFDKTDWFGLTLKANVAQDRSRYRGTPSVIESIRFPDILVQFATSSWTSAIGGSFQRTYGNDQETQTYGYPVHLDWKSGAFEWRNGGTLRMERKQRFGSTTSDTLEGSAKTSVKWIFGEAQFRSYRWLRKNFYLHNRWEQLSSLEYVLKRGNEFDRLVHESTYKVSHRTDYFIKEQFRVYLMGETWKFVNGVASTRNYLAYSVSLGTQVQF